MTPTAKNNYTTVRGRFEPHVVAELITSMSLVIPAANVRTLAPYSLLPPPPLDSSRPLFSPDPSSSILSSVGEE